MIQWLIFASRITVFSGLDIFFFFFFFFYYSFLVLLLLLLLFWRVLVFIVCLQSDRPTATHFSPTVSNSQVFEVEAHFNWWLYLCSVFSGYSTRKEIFSIPVCLKETKMRTRWEMSVVYNSICLLTFNCLNWMIELCVCVYSIDVLRWLQRLHWRSPMTPLTFSNDSNDSIDVLQWLHWRSPMTPLTFSDDSIDVLRWLHWRSPMTPLTFSDDSIDVLQWLYWRSRMTPLMCSDDSNDFLSCKSLVLKTLTWLEYTSFSVHNCVRICACVFACGR